MVSEAVILIKNKQIADLTQHCFMRWESLIYNEYVTIFLSFQWTCRQLSAINLYNPFKLKETTLKLQYNLCFDAVLKRWKYVYLECASLEWPHLLIREYRNMNKYNADLHTSYLYYCKFQKLIHQIDRHFKHYPNC